MEILGIGIVLQLLVISVLLLWIYWKPDPKFPMVSESKVISQTVAVRADADLSTVQPATLAAATCTHDWEVMSEKTLSVPHEQRFAVLLKCRHCGTLDKTVATTSKPPPPEWRKENCRHEWEDEKAVHLDSAFEQVSDSIKKSDMKKFDVEDISSLPRDFFRKTYIKVRICKICGEIHTVQASNYDEVKEEQQV